MSYDHGEEIILDYDTIVVGGGITGLIIARELGKKNLKVLLIEATNRFGGKIYDQSFESNPNEYFPLGAFKFDSSRHKLLSKELNYYQLSYQQVSLFHKSFIRSRYLGLISWEEWYEILQQDSDYHRIIQQINQDSLEINPLEGFPYQLTNEHFDISLFDYLTKRLSLQEYLFEYFSYECAMHFGADLTLITTLQFLNMVKYFESVENMFLFHHKYEQLTNPKGFSALIDAILQDIQQNLPNVTLLPNTPVISISSHVQNKATRSLPPNYDYPESLALLPNYFISMKKVDGSYLHAKGIIVTIPLNSIFSIEFTPSLSPSLIKAVQICDCNRDFIQLFAHVNGISRRVDRVINFAMDSPVWESQVLYRPKNETNKDVGSNESHNKSVISIVGRRREILANPYKWFKDNHPDIQFTQFPTSSMRESLSRQSPTRIIGKHMSKAQEEECLQSSIKDLQSDLLYHDWLSDSWTRSSYFNLRIGLRETFQIALDEVKHPWGSDSGDGKSSGGYNNRSLVIANASLTSHWTGWIEGSLHVAFQTIQHVSSYYIPEKIPKNFARKAKPIDVSAYLNSKK